LLNKRENINFSLFESSKDEKNRREEDERKAKEKLAGDFSTVKLNWICQS
jgi:hypothetical protein